MQNCNRQIIVLVFRSMLYVALNVIKPRKKVGMLNYRITAFLLCFPLNTISDTELVPRSSLKENTLNSLPAACSAHKCME